VGTKPWRDPYGHFSSALFSRGGGSHAAVDLELTFEYESAKFTLASITTLRALGKALTSPELKGNTFVIAGYTDAKGGADFAQRLSESRAEAVKRFLVDEYRIPASDLVAVGFGNKHLKNPADPFGAENRRIRIIHLPAYVKNR
jgi:outer membrane protein OmpA-like peptidoglycan-associated protein